MLLRISSAAPAAASCVLRRQYSSVGPCRIELVRRSSSSGPSSLPPPPTIDKKFAPPPPAFGFAAPKPGTPPPSRPKPTPRPATHRIVTLSVHDVVAEMFTVPLSVKDVAAEMIQQEQNGGGGNVSISFNSSPVSASSTATTASSTTTTSTQARIGALRNPQDIIIALQPLISKSGSVAFDAVPSHIVHALIGHDGFGADPVLSDEKHPGIVQAVTRVVNPVGVFAVSEKRKAIRMRPGVTQLAARIDILLLELSGANATPRKTPFSAIHRGLSGAEKSFVAEVGGLNRVAALFPAQFTVSPDWLNVTRIQSAAEQRRMQEQQRQQAMQQQQQQHQPQQRVRKLHEQPPARPLNITRSTTGSELEDPPIDVAFHEAKQGVLSYDMKRHGHTTGASLLKPGESIFADGDDA